MSASRGSTTSLSTSSTETLTPGPMMHLQATAYFRSLGVKSKICSPNSKPSFSSTLSACQSPETARASRNT
jgi:hypothetical protein